MNKHDQISRQNEDQVRKALEPLKHLRPSSDLRAANQALLLRAASEQKALRSVPVWKRGINVPIPLAALFVIAFVGLGALYLQESLSAPRMASGKPLQHMPQMIPAPEPPPVGPASADECEIRFHQEGFYVAGLGNLSSMRTYKCGRP